MDYIALIVRDKENIDTATIYAEDDSEAYATAKRWAATLTLEPDDKLWLLVKDPNGVIKTFPRSEF